jgi:hypothetical protein
MAVAGRLWRLAIRCQPDQRASAHHSAAERLRPVGVPGVREVSADNFAVGDYTTEDVVSQVTHDNRVIEELTRSDAIEVEMAPTTSATQRSAAPMWGTTRRPSLRWNRIFEPSCASP